MKFICRLFGHKLVIFSTVPTHDVHGLCIRCAYAYKFGEVEILNGK